VTTVTTTTTTADNVQTMVTEASKIVTTAPEIKMMTVSKVETRVTKAEMTDHITITEMVVVDLTNSTIETKDHNKITVVDHSTTTSPGSAVTNLETDFKEETVTVTTIKEDSLIMIRETKNFTVVRLAKTTTEMMMVVVVATSESKEEVDPVNFKEEAHLDKIIETVKIVAETAPEVTVEVTDQDLAIDLNTVTTHVTSRQWSSLRMF